MCDKDSGIQLPAFEIQSILLNDSASLRFAGHDKGERPEARPKKTVSWLASLAICTCRAFSPHFLTGFYFEPRGGYQPDKVEFNKDRSGKQALACNQNSAGVLPNKKTCGPNISWGHKPKRGSAGI